MKCYGLEVITENIENFKDEMEYITNSFKSNRGFIGVYIDKSTPDWKSIALFKTPKLRNECYMRINTHYDALKPRVALVIPVAEIDDQYAKMN